MQVYMPFAQDPSRDVFLVARTAADPRALAGAFETTIHALDRDLPVFSVKPMESVMGEEIARQRMAELVLSVFAGVALFLASIGLFGLVSHSVTERTHEIGVRMALGAGRRDVVRLIVRNGLTMTMAGMAVGLAGAAALAGSLRGLLFGVQPLDPLTFASVAFVLLATAIAACLIPAWRAVQIQPTNALRSE